jgi:hypothetical protein
MKDYNYNGTTQAMSKGTETAGEIVAGVMVFTGSVVLAFTYLIWFGA